MIFPKSFNAMCSDSCAFSRLYKCSMPFFYGNGFIWSSFLLFTRPRAAFWISSWVTSSAGGGDKVGKSSMVAVGWSWGHLCIHDRVLGEEKDLFCQREFNLDIHIVLHLCSATHIEYQSRNILLSHIQLILRRQTSVLVALILQQGLICNFSNLSVSTNERLHQGQIARDPTFWRTPDRVILRTINVRFLVHVSLRPHQSKQPISFTISMLGIVCIELRLQTNAVHQAVLLFQPFETACLQFSPHSLTCQPTGTLQPLFSFSILDDDKPMGHSFL